MLAQEAATKGGRSLTCTRTPGRSRVGCAARLGSSCTPLAPAAAPTAATRRAPSPALRRSGRGPSSPLRLPASVTRVPRAAVGTLAALAPELVQVLGMAKLFAAAVAVGAGVLSALSWLDAQLKTQKPGLQYEPTEFNQRVLSACPTLHTLYRPLPFLTNPHVETILAAKTRTKPTLRYKREILRTADGGCVALDWEYIANPEEVLPEDAPVLVLLPGLTGGSGDSYVLHAVRNARRAGIRAVVFNGRGTADSPVITPQFYSASFTGDTRAVIGHVARLYPRSRALLAAGWSLGANILLRYLGEEGPNTPLRAAVSMCNPFNLTVSNQGLTRGFNQIYDINLAKSLQRIYLKHAALWTGMPPPFRPDDVNGTTIRQFDECITIHSFGWRNVDEYYAGSSSSLSVPLITIPTLCIQALDDPIAPKEATPFDALRQNPNCVLVTTLTGGHLGWMAGPEAPYGAPWSDAAMFEWLQGVLRELAPAKDAAEEPARELVPAVVANGVKV